MLRIKRQWLPWTIATVAAAGLALSISTRPAAAEERDREHNPRIHRALEALYDAHEEIDHSHSMYHNHKREALDAIDHAIDRLEVIKDYQD